MTITEATGTLPTLPGRYYYDPAIHAAERERIFEEFKQREGDVVTGTVKRIGAGGLVVSNGRIIETLRPGQQPDTRIDQVFDASRHVILPGLVNTHHHFYQTLTRAHPQAINKELFDWLTALYPVWSRLTPPAMRLATKLALTELLMSGVTTTCVLP